MLNEKREYELLLSVNYGGLLRRDNVKNNLAGIRPALTVLARGFLELCDNEGLTDLTEKTTLCSEFLKCWIIGEYKVEKAYSKKIIDELKKAQKPSLFNHLVSNQMPIRCLKSYEDEVVFDYLNKKIASWNNSMFYSSKENSVNEIYFKAIIADALYKGPLTNKALALKNHKQNYGIECSKEGEKHLKELLAVVASCLRALPKRQASSNAKLVELSNYINKPTHQKNKRSSVYASMDGFFEEGGFTYNAEPIVRKIELAGGVVKLALNCKWLKDFDVQLIDCDEEITANYIAFTDLELLPNRF